MTVPTLVAAITDEHEELLDHLTNQRDLLWMSTYGLRHEQAVARPTVSDLSLAGIIKHAARAERRWAVAARRDTQLAPNHDRTDFGLQPGETLADVRAFYAMVAEETRSIVAGVVDLEQPVPRPAGTTRFSNERPFWSVRSVLLHAVEETADHVRAADIIRDILDRAEGR